MSETYLHHFELVSRGSDVPGAFRVLERVRGRTLAWSLEDRKPLPTEESGQTASLESDVAGLQVQLMQTSGAGECEPLLDKLVESERGLGLAWTEGDSVKHGLTVDPAACRKIQENLKPG